MTKERAIDILKDYIAGYEKVVQSTQVKENRIMAKEQLELYTLCLEALEAKPKTVIHFNELFKKQEYIDLLNKHGLTVEKFNELRCDFNRLYKVDKNETN